MKVKCSVCGWRYDPDTHPYGPKLTADRVPNHFPMCCPGMGKPPVPAADQGPIRKTWEYER
jgi:rubredoxin